jgi:integrase/recombinase XerD
MRHTAATHMLEAGLPLIYIKNMLGHVSIQTTQIYASISQKAADIYLKEWNKKWFETYDDHRDKESERIPDFLKV